MHTYMCSEQLTCVIGSNVELNKHSHQITGERKAQITKSSSFFAIFIAWCFVHNTEGGFVDEKQTISHYAFIYIHAC